MRLSSSQNTFVLAVCLLFCSLGGPRSSILLVQCSPVPPVSASSPALVPASSQQSNNEPAPIVANEESQADASEAAAGEAANERLALVRVRRSNAYDRLSSAEERVNLMRKLIALRARKGGDSDEGSVERRARQKRYRYVDPLMNGFFEEDKRKRAMPYVDPLMSGFFEEDKRAMPYVDPLMSGFYEEDKRSMPYVDPLMNGFYEEDRRKRAMQYVDPLMSGFYEEDRRKRAMPYVDPLMSGFYEEDKRAMPYVDPLMSGFYEEDRRKRHDGGRRHH